MNLRECITAAATLVLASAWAGCGPAAARSSDTAPQSAGAAIASATDCSPEGDGKIKFICGISHAEDLQRIPGSEWVVTSGLEKNGIRFVNTRTYQHMQVFPGKAARVLFDKRKFTDCPGPTTEEAVDFHGINLREGQDGVHTLYAVRHVSRHPGTRELVPGSREAVEVFEIDARLKTPAITWVGCVPAPEGVRELNSVSALPGDGFVSSNFNWPSDAKPEEFPNGWTNGQVWEWQPGAGWKVVPGSEFFPGPNGLEASKDGAWLFINLWPAKRVLRLSRGQTPVRADLIEVSFQPDNIHWNDDGTLLVAGQGGSSIGAVMNCMVLPDHFGRACPTITAEVARLDPRTLKVTPVLSYPGSIAGASIATVGLQVGREVWLSSDWFDRIVRYPLP